MPKPKTEQILKGCAELSKYHGPKTYKQIADACKCSIALIQQIEIQALKKLRHPTRIKQLKEYKA